MKDITYVGLDVHKGDGLRGGRRERPRWRGTRGWRIREPPDVLRKMVARLGKHRRRLNFWYEPVRADMDFTGC
jgi:hypothetical protein